MNGTTIPVLLTGGFAILAKIAQGTTPKQAIKGSNAKAGGPYAKIILGTFVVGAMLSTLSGEPEKVMTALAWVAFITSLVAQNGITVFNTLSKIGA